MKIVNSNYDQTTMSSNAEMENEKALTTFLSLPAELRNEIYKLSGCLEARQLGDLISDGYCYDSDDGHTEYCRYCSVCSKDGDHCRFCFESSALHRTLSLWVNRNSSFTITGPKDGDRKRNSLRHNNISHTYRRYEREASKHGEHIKNGVEQPALTKVSKDVRDDTLPIFYGSHSFMFTLFDRDIDGASIFKWFRTIGKENATLLKEIKIVVKTKHNKKYAETELKRALKKQGFNAGGGANMKVVKLPYPFCHCERCVRQALGEV